MNIIKRIIKSIIAIFSILLWLLRQLKSGGLKNYLHNKERNKSVFIFGNGPSLKDFIDNPEYKKKRSNNSFCLVNFSALSPLFLSIKPEYYVIADPIFFDRPSRNPNVKPLMDFLLTVNWDLKIFVPYVFYKQIKNDLKQNLKIEVIPFNATKIENRHVSKKVNLYLYSKGWACPRVQNVVIGAIYCMINSGYKNIELYGVDHSWTTLLAVNEKNQVCLKDVHYYDTRNVKMEPWLKCTGEQYKMHEVLRDLAFMFEGYHDLQEYANYIGGINIINNSKESFIDAFKKA